MDEQTLTSGIESDVDKLSSIEKTMSDHHVGEQDEFLDPSDIHQ